MDKEWEEAQAHLLELQSKLLRLDKQRRMFRKRAADMLRRGLSSLDELDAAEEAERLAAESPPVLEAPPPTDSSEPGSYGEMDPGVAEALSGDFDPNHPFWASLGDLGFDGGTSQLGPEPQVSH